MFKAIKKKQLQSYYTELNFLFKNITFVRKHLDIVFVFGGADTTSKRDVFLEFIQDNNNTPFLFVTIEALYKDILKYSTVNRGVSAKK